MATNNTATKQQASIGVVFVFVHLKFLAQRTNPDDDHNLPRVHHEQTKAGTLPSTISAPPSRLLSENKQLSTKRINCSRAGTYERYSPLRSSSMVVPLVMSIFCCRLVEHVGRSHYYIKHSKRKGERSKRTTHKKAEHRQLSANERAMHTKYEYIKNKKVNTFAPHGSTLSQNECFRNHKICFSLSSIACHTRSTYCKDVSRWKQQERSQTTLCT